MKKVAGSACTVWAGRLFIAYFLVLTGCTLPHPSGPPLIYDFGPGALNVQPSSGRAHLPLLEINPPQTSAALNSNAVWYRLAYADAQVLKPYALARWSMTPAQLLGQRLREQLSQQRAVVSPGEVVRAQGARASASAPQPSTQRRHEPLLSLRLELEEFSQLFESPVRSSGLLRLRATVMQRSAVGESLLAQRSFVVQQPAPTPDANGGVRALAAAADQVVREIEQWLGQLDPGQP